MLKEANYSQYLPVSPTLRGGEVMQRTGMWSIPAACCCWRTSLSSFLCLHPRPPPAPLLLRPSSIAHMFLLLLIDHSLCLLITHFVFQSFCEQLVTSCVEPSIKQYCFLLEEKYSAVLSREVLHVEGPVVAATSRSRSLELNLQSLTVLLNNWAF